MGPGANAETEKAILGPTHPNVYFWNQPVQKKAENAFNKLVDSAEAEVRNLVKVNGGEPVNVIAHSFGGHLFHQLTLRDPKLIKSCRFFSTGYDIPAGFFNLLKIMSKDSSTPQDLREKMDEFLNSHYESKAADIWSYIGLIAQDPAFFRHYWPSQNLFSAFIPYASKAPPMDMECFQNILNDFLNHHFTPSLLIKSPWEGPIEIQLGDKDPLIDVSRETKLWKTIFPQAHIKVLKNSGHFNHLENYLNP